MDTNRDLQIIFNKSFEENLMTNQQIQNLLKKNNISQEIQDQISELLKVITDGWTALGEEINSPDPDENI